MRRVEGKVLRLRCEKCGATFPTFVFSGDTDMATMGLASASSCSGNEVVIAEMTNNEWLRYGGDGCADFARRLTVNLNRPLHFVRLLRSEPHSESAVGMSFQAFKRAYEPPALIYSCACCADGEARVESTSLAEEFIAAGGCLTVFGDLAVA